MGTQKRIQLISSPPDPAGQTGYPCAYLMDVLDSVIGCLNSYRRLYLDTKDKTYWWQMIQLLPSSYNQRRTVMLDYEVLANIYRSRKGHKLDEWRDFRAWIQSLPYCELITGESDSGR